MVLGLDLSGYIPHIYFSLRKSFAQTLVALMLIMAIGGHWFVLQSVAWVGMVTTFAKIDSLQVALAKTFDGKHPCKLCKLVKVGEKAERKQNSVKTETKFELFSSFDQASFELPQNEVTAGFKRHSVKRLLKSQAPPIPPPRVA